METKKNSKRIWEVRIFYFSFDILCLVNLAFCAYGFWTLPASMKLISEQKQLTFYYMSSRISWLLINGIIIWLLANIFRLIKAISKGEPFGSWNPRRVRKIAFAALALGSVVFFEKSLQYLFVPFVLRKSFLYDLMGVPMWAAFVGLTLLVISRVFEEGYKLREDGNLTI